MLKIKVARQALVAAVLLTAQAARAGEETLVLNFDEAPVGETPPAVQDGGASGALVRVVGRNSDPADPFGGETNRSLMIEKDGLPSPWVILPLDKDWTKGEFSFRFFHDNSGQFAGPVRSFVRLCGNGATVIALQCSPSKLSFIDHEEKAQLFDQRLSPSKANIIAIRFDLEKGVFRGAINEAPLTIGSVDEFPLRTDPFAVNQVMLRVGTDDGPLGRSFFDDIQFTTQPAVGEKGQ